LNYRSIVLTWLFPLSVDVVEKIGGLSQRDFALNNISKQSSDLLLLPMAFTVLIGTKGTFQRMDEVDGYGGKRHGRISHLWDKCRYFRKLQEVKWCTVHRVFLS
jgi:hypothetical protein